MTTYTHGHHDSVLRSHRWRTAQNSAAFLLPHLQPGMTVLDVGCGPGTITLDLARAVGPSGSVVGVDSAAAVIAEARQNAVQAGVDNVRFDVGDARALDAPDATFDVVYAHQVLHHVGDPVAVLREMRRVRKPDGVVAAREADYRGMIWYPQLPALDEWMALFQRAARFNGTEPDAGRRVLGWALDAGFATVTPSASVWCHATPQDRQWWGGLWSDRIMQSDLAGQALTHGWATRSDLERIATAWRAWADDEHGWFAIVHGEVLCRD